MAIRRRTNTDRRPQPQSLTEYLENPEKFYIGNVRDLRKLGFRLVNMPRGKPIVTESYAARWRGMINFDDDPSLAEVAKFATLVGMRPSIVKDLKENIKTAEREHRGRGRTAELRKLDSKKNAFDWAVRDAIFTNIEQTMPDAKIQILGTDAKKPDPEHVHLVGEILSPAEAFSKENLRRWGCGHAFRIL
jgi:hypothetical protein